MSEDDRKLFVKKTYRIISREMGFCRDEIKYLHDTCGLSSGDESAMYECMDTLLLLLKKFCEGDE